MEQCLDSDGDGQSTTLYPFITDSMAWEMQVITIINCLIKWDLGWQ